jgi:RHS repeat-associated protein
VRNVFAPNLERTVDTRVETDYTVQTVTSPIPNQTWTITWEQPFPAERPNFYRVTKITDPLGHWVQFGYPDPNDPNDPNDPTLVIKITEPPTGGRDPAALTVLDYGDDDNNRGQLTSVIDANGVEHTFEYDEEYGYPAGGREGLVDLDPPAGYPVGGKQDSNPLGLTIAVCDDVRKCCAQISINVFPLVISTSCYCQTGGGEGWPRRLGDVPSPHWGFLTQSLDSASYDNSGRPTSLTVSNLRWSSSSEEQDGSRVYEFDYDDLGRPKNFTFSTNEHGGDPAPAHDVVRAFVYSEPNDPNGPQYDPDGRVVRFEGPDGQITEYSWDDDGEQKPGYDPLGRPETITRGDLSVTYTYDDAGRVTCVDYGNGAMIVRDYDDANRLEQIRHYGTGSAVPLYQIDYVWSLDNTVGTRVETDYTVQPVQVATVELEYDTRHRLTRETRTLAGQTPVEVYDLEYFYDQVGNRSMKVDNVSERETYYTYDTDLDPNDPSQWPGYPGEVYPTRNNRLLKYKEYDDSGVEPVLLRTVHYVYYETGDVSNIIVKDEYAGEGDPNDFEWYRGLAFTYWAYGGTTPGLVLWERWKDDGQGGFTDYEKLALREFRYHPNPRGRFMVRELHPDDEPWEWSTVGAEHWTDYDIPMPNGDFDVTFDPNEVPVATETTRYLEGFGLPAQQTVSSGATEYLHADLVRSTNLLTDANGAAVGTTAYTAFGEVIGSDLDTRYEYAGGWGYESDLLVLDGAPGTTPIRLVHVGHRWYQPDIGRFIQRDPLGVFGAVNVYGYVTNNPVVLVDPNGKFVIEIIIIATGVYVVVKTGIKLYEKSIAIKDYGNRLEHERIMARLDRFPGRDHYFNCIKAASGLADTPNVFHGGQTSIPTDLPGAIGVGIREGVGRSGALDPPPGVVY